MEIYSELAASVWKVLVTEGVQVEAGDTLLILESMKMEIPVDSEVAGVVERVHVTEGSQVDEDQLLVTIV